MATARPTLSLKGRALKYLAAREHSRSELIRKLAPHAEDPAEIDRVLDELQSRGFLSEERFVASVVHRRATGHGAARIRRELSLKGITAEQMRDTLEALQPSELARAHAVWARRFGTLATDPREHGRQVRFLMARGFSGDVVRRVLKGEGADPD
ncbi:recombination regulator RecX [Sphaerotilus sp.]|uniref:recombination regulator RecX n=1 Tax=Sphaerotilus sp. TaxID=2093942 RepID=UPI002ACE7D94|nr:recombination regulator RecX [Sphaerotilus sp.]MDZ7855120.1 recombination regulator RecX [Sphaerotilus sp.]